MKNIKIIVIGSVLAIALVALLMCDKEVVEV